MEAKIKVIIKRPDEKYGHVTWISDTLENLQRIVEGHIEVVPITPVLPDVGLINNGLIMICNEEGKILGLEKNFIMGILAPDVIVGTVIICGTDGDEFGDVPIDMSMWKRILSHWEN